MSHLTRLLVLISFMLSLSVSAADPQPSPQPELKPLDEILTHLDQTLKKIKNPKARALRQAYEQLQAKQFAKARSFAQAALGDPTFSDYAHWLIASASYEQAQIQAQNEKPKDAAASARNAFQHYGAVLNGNPYSPFHRQAPKMLGASQLLLGWGSSPSKESVRAFEDAFERLGITNGGSSLLLPEQIEAFTDSCEKFPNELCKPWVSHLGEKHNGPGAPHSTQVYHAPDLDLTAFDDAMGAYLSEKWSDSLDKFQKFNDEFPKSALRFRARYWLGRAQLEKRKFDEAKKGFASLEKDTPLSYYGMLAAAANSEQLDQQVTAAIPQAAESDTATSASELYHLKRALIFLGEKSPDLAGMELKEIRPRATLSGPFVMYLAALNFRAQNFPSLFGMLTELFQRGYEGLNSKAVEKMIFPVVQMERIRKYSDESKIDPILILSLMKQESGFDTRAFSGSGAAGLMQIMYFTATETVPGISRTDLLEPEQNIKVGTRYLAKLLTKYHGNIVLSLAAYNAGPIPVDRWVREGVKQKYKMLEFIESIQYKETRDYVSAIIRNYYWYSKLLGAPLPMNLSYFWSPYGELQHEIGGPELPVPSPSPTPTANHSP